MTSVLQVRRIAHEPVGHAMRVEPASTPSSLT